MEWNGGHAAPNTLAFEKKRFDNDSPDVYVGDGRSCSSRNTRW